MFGTRYTERVVGCSSPPGSIISGCTDGLMYAVEGPIITCAFSPATYAMDFQFAILQHIPNLTVAGVCSVCGYSCEMPLLSSVCILPRSGIWRIEHRLRWSHHFRPEPLCRLERRRVPPNLFGDYRDHVCGAIHLLATFPPGESSAEGWGQDCLPQDRMGPNF